MIAWLALLLNAALFVASVFGLIDYGIYHHLAPYFSLGIATSIFSSFSLLMVFQIKVRPRYQLDRKSNDVY